MDANTHESDVSEPRGSSPLPSVARSAEIPRGLGSKRLGEALGQWQRTELRIARGFAECRGLTTEQLEDIYQDTALALLARPYATEEHLRNALRHGIKHRALNMHRDTRRRTQILAEHAPNIQRVAEGRASQAGPEQAALADQDRYIVREFLTELDELEQRVFWLIADGMRYRAIASALEIPVNEARNASRSCERKRERFQLLYDTGRLCGYRAATIQALQGGEVTTEELADRAFAHLEGCASCRAEHKTNAKRLGQSFRGQIAAVLPLPALSCRLPLWLRHCLPSPTHPAGGVRDRGVALIAAGGGAKLTASVATVAVIAAGTIDATHALERGTTRDLGHDARPPTSRTERPIMNALAALHDTMAWNGSHHRKPFRARSIARVGTSRSQALSRPGTTGQGATRHEFGPESEVNTPAKPNAISSRDEGGGKTTEREFGIATTSR
jgi:RNA polymerase sigma factor (sigma-70 family)